MAVSSTTPYSSYALRVLFRVDGQRIELIRIDLR